MKIKFCGAAGDTTGSQHLLEINGRKILLDCGLYQGRRKDSYQRNRNFLYDPAKIDCVVLSHAHIDHSGNLPNLVKNGFNGPIYSTFATRDLCQIMLADSAKIQIQDIKYLNKKRKKQNLEALEPTYDEVDAEKCLRSFVNIGYERQTPIADGVYLTFVDAGHILGSAQIILDIENFQNNKKYRFLFSGDVGRGNNDLLRNPTIVKDVDFLLMESTYGNRLHKNDGEARNKIVGIIKETKKKRGKVIIPAFAVERTQQLIFTLNQLLTAKLIPEIPVFVDSPLAVNATEIFRLHPECFNKKLYNFLFEKRNPFGFESLTLVRKVSKSIELNSMIDPAVIISESGMCEAGRILHHLKNNIEDSKNTILFVGFCAQNTLGAKIRNKDNIVNILGKKYKLMAKVEELDEYSGHADRDELLQYFKNISGSKTKTWLVHGEKKQSQAFKKLLESNHVRNIHVAKLNEELEIL